ncbi:MAG: hypothetical protein LBG43_10595 [Treponema sp.]|jgi:hypothetical protein|nr:hypothetical protein [Treponema sp.]
MKKPALLSLIFAAVLKTYSLDLEATLTFGEVAPGFETDFSSIDFITTITAAPVTFQSKSGWGLSFSPFSFTTKNGSNSSMTFINPALFYNFFKTIHIRLGPFISINALDMYNIGFFKLTAGVSFSWQVREALFENPVMPLALEIVQLQAGYAYYENKGAFYMRAGFDLFVFLVSAAYNESGKYHIEKDTLPPPR